MVCEVFLLDKQMDLDELTLMQRFAHIDRTCIPMKRLR